MPQRQHCIQHLKVRRNLDQEHWRGSQKKKHYEHIMKNERREFRFCLTEVSPDLQEEVTISIKPNTAVIKWHCGALFATSQHQNMERNPVPTFVPSTNYYPLLLPHTVRSKYKLFLVPVCLWWGMKQARSLACSTGPFKYWRYRWASTEIHVVWYVVVSTNFVQCL